MAPTKPRTWLSPRPRHSLLVHGQPTCKDNQRCTHPLRSGARRMGSLPTAAASPPTNKNITLPRPPQPHSRTGRSRSKGGCRVAAAPPQPRHLPPCRRAARKAAPQPATSSVGPPLDLRPRIWQPRARICRERGSHPPYPRPARPATAPNRASPTADSGSPRLQRRTRAAPRRNRPAPAPPSRLRAAPHRTRAEPPPPRAKRKTTASPPPSLGVPGFADTPPAAAMRGKELGES